MPQYLNGRKLGHMLTFTRSTVPVGSSRTLRTEGLLHGTRCDDFKELLDRQSTRPDGGANDQAMPEMMQILNWDLRRDFVRDSALWAPRAGRDNGNNRSAVRLVTRCRDTNPKLCARYLGKRVISGVSAGARLRPVLSTLALSYRFFGPIKAYVFAPDLPVLLHLTELGGRQIGHLAQRKRAANWQSR